MSKPPASQNALLLPMGSLWWVDIFCIQDPSLICCAEGEPFPQMAIQKRSWIQTLQLYLSHCTWAQFQAPHLQACTGHVLLQVLTRLWAFLSHSFPQRGNQTRRWEQCALNRSPVREVGGSSWIPCMSGQDWPLCWSLEQPLLLLLLP